MRSAKVERNTGETAIQVELALDDVAKGSYKTGLPFFDHMLEQFAKHGQFDITIKSFGDLEIDQHHTIEDVAIALGEAFKSALGDRKNIERYSIYNNLFFCNFRINIDSCRKIFVCDSTIFFNIAYN